MKRTEGSVWDFFPGWLRSASHQQSSGVKQPGGGQIKSSWLVAALVPDEKGSQGQAMPARHGFGSAEIWPRTDFVVVAVQAGEGTAYVLHSVFPCWSVSFTFCSEVSRRFNRLHCCCLFLLWWMLIYVETSVAAPSLKALIITVCSWSHESRSCLSCPVCWGTSWCTGIPSSWLICVCLLWG